MSQLYWIRTAYVALALDTKREILADLFIMILDEHQKISSGFDSNRQIGKIKLTKKKKMRSN